MEFAAGVIRRSLYTPVEHVIARVDYGARKPAKEEKIRGES